MLIRFNNWSLDGLSLALFVVVVLLAFTSGCTSKDDAASEQSAQVPAPPAAPAPEPAVEQPNEVEVEVVASGETGEADTGVQEEAVTEPADAKETEPSSTSADVKSDGPRQHIIQGVVTQWRPMVLFVEPGDQIVFRQMAGHDTQSIDGMIPEGAEPWTSKLGEEGYAISLDVPGVYIYKCNPHVSLGMIGAIVVGDRAPHNLEQIEAHPQNKGMIGRAIRKLKQALAE